MSTTKNGKRYCGVYCSEPSRLDLYLIRNTLRFTCLIESAGQKILCTFLNRLFAYKGFTLNKCNLFGKLGCSNFLINYKFYYATAYENPGFV